MEELHAFREKSVTSSIHSISSQIWLRMYPMYAKHRASFMYIIYVYIYMHNIYIMYGVTVCCLHAVLWIAIPGQRSFFFLFLLACLQSSTCVSRVSMTKCEVFSFIFTELSFYYFGSIFFFNSTESDQSCAR